MVATRHLETFKHLVGDMVNTTSDAIFLPLPVLHVGWVDVAALLNAAASTFRPLPVPHVGWVDVLALLNAAASTFQPLLVPHVGFVSMAALLTSVASMRNRTHDH